MTEPSASFNFRAGDHHDGMYYFGLGANITESYDGNPPTSTTAKTNRPRSVTIVLTRIDGGVIGTDFTLH